VYGCVLSTVLLKRIIIIIIICQTSSKTTSLAEASCCRTTTLWYGVRVTQRCSEMAFPWRTYLALTFLLYDSLPASCHLEWFPIYFVFALFCSSLSSLLSLVKDEHLPILVFNVIKIITSCIVVRRKEYGFYCISWNNYIICRSNVVCMTSYLFCIVVFVLHKFV